MIDGVLLAPLPYDEPARIVEVGKVSQGTDRIFAMSAPDVFDLQERTRSFAALAASMVTRLTVLGDGEPQAFRGAMVSPEFFAVLGIQPSLGRPFTAAEDAAATPVAVLSHGVWQRRWEGDPALVGESGGASDTTGFFRASGDSGRGCHTKWLGPNSQLWASV